MGMLKTIYTTLRLLESQFEKSNCTVRTLRAGFAAILRPTVVPNILFESWRGI